MKPQFVPAGLDEPRHYRKHLLIFSTATQLVEQVPGDFEYLVSLSKSIRRLETRFVGETHSSKWHEEWIPRP